MLGVGITLFAGNILTNTTEKRDLKLYLNTILIEVEENIKNFEHTYEFFNYEFDLVSYLRSINIASIDMDSLAILTSISTVDGWFTRSPGNPNSLQNIASRPQLSDKAFEIFKSSGRMQLINDKDFILHLWRTYNTISETSRYAYDFHRIKLDAISELFHASADHVEIPLKDFYLNNFMKILILRQRLNYSVTLLRELLDMLINMRI
jgi:hypothetical protein